MKAPIVVIGCGMVGPVVAMYLARRYGNVAVVERGPRPDKEESSTPWQSLSVILSARGWRTLRDLGLESSVRRICLPLTGRMAHLDGVETQFERYSAHGDRIWCVDRNALHALLVAAAEATPGVRIDHNVRVKAVDPAEATVVLERDGVTSIVESSRIVGCDGVRSLVRAAIAGLTAADRVEHLTVGYKEFDLQPDEVLRPLSNDCFHYWPRGRTFFGAFPTLTGKFAGSLFMATEGSQDSFSSVRTKADALDLFARSLPDVAAMIPDLTAQYLSHPVRTISTIRTDTWVWRDRAVLVGDSCHAMPPFMGQGMNCGFEDARILDSCLAAHGWTATAFDQYQRVRRPSAAAIEEISFEHYQHLTAQSPKPESRTRGLMRERLAHMYPKEFLALYERCAFTEQAYEQAYADHAIGEAILDSLIAIHDETLTAAPDGVVDSALREAVQRVLHDYRSDTHDIDSTVLSRWSPLLGEKCSS